jgi:DNA mismatch endonuclease (patch repair protein)
MNSSTAKKIKSKNTVIEKTLASALFKKGLRYRRNDPTVYGKPDFTFRKQKVAVFCDSEFWHGKNYLNGQKFKANKDFWERKIKRNIERDREVDKRLKNEGWVVLRFWGKEIIKNTDNCVDMVSEASTK